MQAFLRVAIIGLATGTGAFAEINTPMVAPPQPASVRVEVLRGDSVEIPLKLQGTSSKDVRFRIRSSPRYGSLTLLRDESGSIRALYKHSGEKGHQADGFTFAAQNELGISAPAQVNLAIKDQPPLFEFPAVVNSGTVFIGHSATTQVVLENRGGGLLQGQIRAEAPWKIKGNPRYRLAAGQRTMVELVFAPSKETEYEGQLRFSHELSRACLLKGAGVYPIALKTREITLQSGSNGRAGFFELLNRSAEDRIVSLVSGEQLELPPRVTIPANGTKRVDVSIDDAHPQRTSTSLTVIDGDASMEVAVRVPASKPILKAIPAQIQFPQVNNGEKQRFSLELTNRGGTGTTVQGIVPEPFYLEAADTNFELPAGGKRTVELGVRPAEPGHYQAELSFKAENSELMVPLEAVVAGTVTSAAKTQKQGSQAKSLSSPMENQGASPVLPGFKLPPVKELVLKSTGPTKAVLEWKGSEQLEYRVELRAFRLLNGKPEPDWLPMRDAAISAKDGVVTARLSGLKPEWPYTVRVVYQNAKKIGSESSALLQFVTDKSLWKRISGFQVLCAAAAVLGAMVVYGRWKKD